MNLYGRCQPFLTLETRKTRRKKYVGSKTKRAKFSDIKNICRLKIVDTYTADAQYSGLLYDCALIDVLVAYNMFGNGFFWSIDGP